MSDSSSHGHPHDRGVRAVFRYVRWAPELWRSDVNDAVIDLVTPIRGEVMVDVGAGVGAGTVPAARRGASVVAIEPTAFLRTVLRVRRLAQRSRKRITVIDAGVEHLPIDDASVHAVWAVNSMHHWVDLERGIAEIARVLRPNGRVVLVDEDFTDPRHPDHDRFGGPADADDHHDNDHDDHHHHDEHHGFTLVDAARMGDLLRSAGLVDIEADKRDIAGRPAIVVTATGAGVRSD